MNSWLKLFQRMWLKWAEGSPWLTSVRQGGQRGTQHFYQAYKFIVMALEAIALALHKEDLSSRMLLGILTQKPRPTVYYMEWPPLSLLFSWLSISTSLTWLALLQSTTVGILHAYQQIEAVKRWTKLERISKQVLTRCISSQREWLQLLALNQPSQELVLVRETGQMLKLRLV